MRGIYYFEEPALAKVSNIGVKNKIFHQIKCLEELGDVAVIKAVYNNNFWEKFKFLLPMMKSDRERQMEKMLKLSDDAVDYIYIRMPLLTMEFYKVLKKIKDNFPNICIILEIPTFPFHSEYAGISKLKVIKSIKCERRLRNVVDKIITYSQDKTIWGIPTVKMSNCVSYKDVPPRSANYKLKKQTIRLTCVANFAYWHGLDRLIEGMKRYNGKYKIILNVVGDGEEINNLKLLSSGMKNVVFHGIKTGEDLTKIFDATDIAVDALGRHRTGVFFNSSLKGKEYVARGIPVVSAVKTELDNVSSFPYYFRFLADESYIDINDVIRFYDTVYSADTPENITIKIRKITKKLFDYEWGFKKIIQGIVEGKMV